MDSMKQSSRMTRTTATTHSVFKAALDQFQFAEKLMDTNHELSLIISTGEFERIILQQVDRPGCQIIIDRLASVQEQEAVVMRIDVEEEYTSRTLPHATYRLCKSYVAYNDDAATVHKLLEIDDQICTQELKTGEKKDLLANVSDGHLMLVD